MPANDELDGAVKCFSQEVWLFGAEALSFISI
jgi:hypothetical protein